MSYHVVFAPEAEEHLVSLYQYVAAASSPDIASRYAEAIVSYCESLCTFPNRGTARDNIRMGLRITNYKKRVVIAYAVDGETISIIGIFYGGGDYESILHPASDKGPES
ncbi:type II toxin-antitoxin system RelE/ParE family toxin [Massilia sp. PAMC28688]|uniref:type II toxin-antitoxin system RelE/ParE family toxin n=1 Tax=Massilia sp. PAMC28688 TaxID=2861283 RepID=UPI001C6268E8|nr:type II toxin-antitoxin system RelE/ParE family toxin [Massilia sp. PAMC28688]QYF93148.1 type II toxin-antitoxin system RelE/ParE family toxin [Massilia sp. PAMC28688]